MMAILQFKKLVRKTILKTANLEELKFNIPIYEQKSKIYQAIEKNDINYVKEWLLDYPMQEQLNQVYLEKRLIDGKKSICKTSLLFLAIEKHHDEIAKMLIDTHAIYVNWKNHNKENSALFAHHHASSTIYDLVLHHPRINVRCLSQTKTEKAKNK
jgi:hypothetical protein